MPALPAKKKGLVFQVTCLGSRSRILQEEVLDVLYDADPRTAPLSSPLPLARPTVLWEEMIEESLDSIDYIEEKLLDLENSPTSPDILRKIWSAYLRLADLGLQVHLRPGIELIQRTRALLEYLRQETIEMKPYEIRQIFEGGRVLQDLFRLRAEQPPELSSLRLPASVQKAYSRQLQWIRQKLEEMEIFQRWRVEGAAPKLGELLVAQGLISRHVLQQIMAEKKDRPLGERLVEAGQLSREQLEEALDLQARFRKQTQVALSVDVGAMMEIRNLSGDLGATLRHVKTLIEASSSPVDPGLSTLLDHLSSLSKGITKKIRSFSKVFFKERLERLSRLAEEFSRRFSRDFTLELEDNACEVERSQAEAIEQIVSQLLRLAIEHGLEGSAERQQKGKEEKGWLSITSRYEKQSFVVEIEDDGQGLPLGHLQAEALRQGLLHPKDAGDERKLLHLIFERGVTIQDRFTNNAYHLEQIGKQVRALQGEMSYRPSSRGGSLFRLCFPLPPSYLQGILLRDRGEYFLIPSSALREVVPSSQASIHADAKGCLFASLEGEAPLPLLRLPQTSRPPLPPPASAAAALGVLKIRDAGFLEGEAGLERPCSFAQITQMSSCQTPQAFCLFLESPDGKAALCVEEVHKEMMVEILFVGSSFLQAPMIGGGAFLPDGRMAWIVDAAQICRPSGEA